MNRRAIDRSRMMQRNECENKETEYVDRWIDTG